MKDVRDNKTMENSDFHAEYISQEHRHVLIILNNYCFSTTTMVTLTGLSVTLYVHCLSCLD